VVAVDALDEVEGSLSWESQNWICSTGLRDAYLMINRRRGGASPVGLLKAIGQASRKLVIAATATANEPVPALSWTSQALLQSAAAFNSNDAAVQMARPNSRNRAGVRSAPALVLLLRHQMTWIWLPGLCQPPSV
jgi:hypothetical protein